MKSWTLIIFFQSSHKKTTVAKNVDLQNPRWGHSPPVSRRNPPYRAGHNWQETMPTLFLLSRCRLLQELGSLCSNNHFGNRLFLNNSPLYSCAPWALSDSKASRALRPALLRPATPSTLQERVSQEISSTAHALFKRLGEAWINIWPSWGSKCKPPSPPTPAVILLTFFSTYLSLFIKPRQYVWPYRRTEDFQTLGSFLR